jgi:Flp pilus assembly protein TadG
MTCKEREMKPKLAERGQALILIALAAIGLFAITGLAIDGSAKYSDRRHAQNAADTAALAGALALTNEKTDWKLDALDRAADNGYVDSVNEVKVYRCDEVDATCGDYYDGSPNYVQVIITSHVNTYFARVIGIQETVNTVSAVTYWSKKGPTYGTDVLKSVSTEQCTGSNGNIVFGGNGDITLDGGGAYINSGGDCGMELTGCGDLAIVNGGDLTTVGSGNINLEPNNPNCAETVDTPPEDTYKNNYDPGFPFPPEMPAQPDECTSPLGSWTVENGVTHLMPGKYYEFPPQKTQTQPVTDIIVMAPGVYCVDALVKLQDQALDLTGIGVTIYIKPDNGQFDVQGGHIHLEAPTTGDYAGYLIIINSDFAGEPPDCKINGNSSNVYVGTIFAPYCDFTFAGTNETGDPDLTYNTQVVAYTIALTGNSNITFYYDTDEVAQSNPKVGIMR